MREIEKDTIKAINNAKDALKNNLEFEWHKQNMMVDADRLNKCVRVFLHGNCIARLYRKYLTVTLAGWNTNTTRSRVNTLINEYCDGHRYGIHQKNGMPYFREDTELKQINEFISIDIRTIDYNLSIANNL